MSLKIREITKVIEDLAPLSFAEEWDNPGLIVGEESVAVRGILVCLDLTTEALNLAIEKKCNLIITHHPILFRPTKVLNDIKPINHLVFKAIQNNINIYAAHTNLDAAVGGVNDALCRVLELAPGETLIGKSYPEIRSWCDRLSPAVKKFTQFGQEPGLKIIPGFGRICATEEPISLKLLLRRINNNLASLGCSVNTDQDKLCKRYAVCSGAFDESWIEDVVKSGVDVLIAGEIKHNVLVALAEFGVAAIAAGHDVTERTILHPLKSYLKMALSQEVNIEVYTGLDYNNLL